MHDRVTCIWAFVSIDRHTGKETILAMRDAGGAYLPLVSEDREHIESLKMIARRIAKDSGLEIKLIRFTHREDLPL